MDINNLESNKIIGLGELIQFSWDLFKVRWWSLLKIASVSFLCAILYVVLGLLALLLFLVPSFSIWTYLGIFWLAILFVLLVVIQSWCVLAINVAISSESEPSFFAAYCQARPFIKSYLWIMFVQSLIVLAGLFLVFIPGMIFSIWFGFAAWVLVVENKTGFSALVQSRQYFKKRFWRIAGYLIFAGLITSFISGAINPVFRNLPFPYSLIFLVPVSYILSLLSGIFVNIYCFKLYCNLKTITPEVSFGKMVVYKIFMVLGLIIIAGVGALVVYNFPSIQKGSEWVREGVKKVNVPSYSQVQEFIKNAQENSAQRSVNKY